MSRAKTCFVAFLAYVVFLLSDGLAVRLQLNPRSCVCSVFNSASVVLVDPFSDAHHFVNKIFLIL
jgi:hypothetical protein